MVGAWWKVIEYQLLSIENPKKRIKENHSLYESVRATTEDIFFCHHQTIRRSSLMNITSEVVQHKKL